MKAGCPTTSAARSAEHRAPVIVGALRSALCAPFFPCLLLLLAGCRNANQINQELLESELRAKEIQYRELMDEHEKTEQHATALERELDAVRKHSKISSEEAQTAHVRRITLGRLTGGEDTDNKAGDDALLLVLEPRDEFDHVIKAPGRVQVWALQINPEGVKSPLTMWQIGSDELARAWKSNLFASGYTLTLPWKMYPTCENLRITVRLTVPDGRIFEADKDIHVRLLPGADRLRTPPSKMPETPAPEPIPPPLNPSGGGPATLNRITPASQWQAAPLDAAVTIQRPAPISD